jgi:hypothetical protein
MPSEKITENHYALEWAGYMPFCPVLLPIQKTFGSPYHALAQIPHMHFTGTMVCTLHFP